MSKLYYVHVFCRQHTTKGTQSSQGIGSSVRRAEHIQVMFWLRHHLKTICMSQSQTWGYKAVIYTTDWDHLLIREHYLYNTIGNKLSLLDVANGKAVCSVEIKSDLP